MQWYLAGVAAIHVLFMIAELFPWKRPILLRTVSRKKLSEKENFSGRQVELVAAIVHNAGIYNGIVAGGLAWAALGGHCSVDVARVMLAGAAVAGVFGAVSLKSLVPAVQAAAGVIGLFLLR